MTLINLEQMSKEELIRELRKLQTAEARFISNASEPDPKRLIHDLQVHQVQLEMQNRELREAQELLEESRSRYADLYDFAPVGYCTFDSEGRIREINLTGAAMLGAPREAILDRPFTSVVSIKETHSFRAHLRECAQRNARVTTELTLSAKGHAPAAVQLVTFSTGSGETPGDGFRTALVDISRLKELETRLRFLAQAGETLASSLDYPTTLAAVVRFAVPLFADLCFVDVLDEDGRVQRLEVVFADASKQSGDLRTGRQAHPQAGLADTAGRRYCVGRIDAARGSPQVCHGRNRQQWPAHSVDACHRRQVNDDRTPPCPRSSARCSHPGRRPVGATLHGRRPTLRRGYRPSGGRRHRQRATS